MNEYVCLFSFTPRFDSPTNFLLNFSVLCRSPLMSGRRLFLFLLCPSLDPLFSLLVLLVVPIPPGAALIMMPLCSQSSFKLILIFYTMVTLYILFYSFFCLFWMVIFQDLLWIFRPFAYSQFIIIECFPFLYSRLMSIECFPAIVCTSVSMTPFLYLHKIILMYRNLYDLVFSLYGLTLYNDFGTVSVRTFLILIGLQTDVILFECLK